MASLSKIILFCIPIVFFFGQLLRIDTKFFSFPVLDLFIILLASSNLIQKFIQKKIEIKNKYFLYFLAFAYISFFINLIIHPIFSLNSLFYLIRLSCLLSLVIFPISLKINNPRFQQFFNLSIFANIIFGLIQYLFWPNFTYFNALNWDPHLYRLVSTFFDPTFTALIYLFFIGYIFTSKLQTKFKVPLLIISYIAFVLTYSRASFISFAILFAFFAYKYKNIKIFIISSFLIISTLFLLPRQAGEGTKLERTSSITAKIENYKEAFGVFKQSPIIGIGYNNIASVRINPDPQSHADAAFDGSLIDILVTTGIIGLVIFCIGLFHFFNRSSILIQGLIITTIFHSLFANSLLYPWVLLYLFLIV